MARSARRIDLDLEADEAVLQATFDFLPQELRHRRRFGSEAAAEAAERRAQLRLVDRQVTGLGSRIVAARLREILRPREISAGEIGAGEIAPVLGQECNADPIRSSVPSVPRDLAALERERAALREMGNVLFYFRDGEELSQVTQQKLHPRPLPARYYDRND
ncbi:hypothetical protein [Dongia sp.]|uniref:hypothetical protein n=1 Tax=Dongia sp. TaxID=1977262 RepID=UPI0035AEEDFC